MKLPGNCEPSPRPRVSLLPRSQATDKNPIASDRSTPASTIISRSRPIQVCSRHYLIRRIFGRIAFRMVAETIEFDHNSFPKSVVVFPRPFSTAYHQARESTHADKTETSLG